jgi:hypothetical protein
MTAPFVGRRSPLSSLSAYDGVATKFFQVKDFSEIKAILSGRFPVVCGDLDEI